MHNVRCRYRSPILLACLHLTGLLFLLPGNGHAQSFSTSTLTNITISNPTSLQFGPDQKLYVSEQGGKIKVLTIERVGANDYTVISEEVILLVQNIMNHYDDGSALFVQQRQVTGLFVTGTPAFPILYVTSSDYRIGGGGSGSDADLDTNSGVISRLTWNGASWEKVDLVRGLPRSEENHATNGLLLDPNTNILYVAQGGNSNAGAPSNNFAFATEYALSSCLLKVDLNAIDAMPILTDTASGDAYIYDLPTVDDPERSNANGIDDPLAMGYDGVDLHDPFGGNDGLNQAKIVIGGPVQIFASGFRNPYDIVLSQAGKFYTWDNGANVGWGGHPDNEGGGAVTNDWVPGEPGSETSGPNDAVVNNEDGLHLITGTGYYGGHPNPIRANPDSAGLFTHPDIISGGENGIFRTEYLSGNPDTSLPYDWPPVPGSLADPVQGDFQNPGVSNSALYIHEKSTNGLVEYTASNFDSAMTGDLLAVSFDDKIYRVNINAAGTIDNNSSVTVLGSGFGSVPLDVTSPGDGGPFPGSIWIADYGASSIIVFEPQDFENCTGIDSVGIDEDADGYTNADEFDNGTDPCNGASKPDDFDKTLIGGFLVSNLNDPDDDDDGIVDSLDYFVWDFHNGTSTQFPLDYPLLNGDPGFGFYGLGFTGLMSNQVDDYLDLWKTEENSEVEIVAGGAVGLFTVNNVTDGDALVGLNDQHDAFQFGLNITQGTVPFIIEGKILGPAFIGDAEDNQNAGIYIGTGDQDNYYKIAVHANGGAPGIRTTFENAGGATSNHYAVAGIENASEISFFLEVNPGNGTVQPKYALGAATPANLGSIVNLSGQILTTIQSADALAIGVIATSRGTDSTFNATWDYIKVDYAPNTSSGQWIVTQDGTNCQPLGQPGSCLQGRHENAFLEVGDKFYILGGRENGSNVNIYNPTTDIWTVGAAPPVQLHHFQAVVYRGMIWVIGALQGGFPNETPVSHIYIYDPVENHWLQGPELPANRKRGAAGAVVYNEKIYLVGGIQNGHVSGWVSWFDEYNPSSGTWTQLSDAPRARDHFQVATNGNKLYVAGGRRTNEFGDVFEPLEQNVDVYDFNTNAWSTLAQQLPTGRAGAPVAIFGNELLVVGGEVPNNFNALDITEAYHFEDQTWRTLDNLNVGRHASQLILNNGGLYLSGGSPAQGESTTQVSEAFYFYGQTTPIMGSLTASTLITSVDTIFFGEVTSLDTVEASFTITSQGGDQGILISNIDLLNVIDYEYVSLPNLPFVLNPGESRTIGIQYHPDGLDNDFAVARIFHSGAIEETNIYLTGNGALQPEGVYINAGGPTVFTGGVVWQEDQYYSAGSTYSVTLPIGNTDDDVIYQTDRNRNGNFSYNIPVDTGWQEINLHFAEIFYVSNGAGGFYQTIRRFDVSVEDSLVLDNYSINSENAPIDTPSAIIKTYQFNLQDTVLNIQFDQIAAQPKISAISVIPLPCPPPGQACDDGNPYTVDDVMIENCGCEGKLPQEIWLEAECGTVGSLWPIQNTATASNNQMLNAPATSIGSAQQDPEDLVIMDFYVNEPDIFKIYGRVRTTSSSTDSYWVKVDNGSWKNWNTINNNPYTDTFRWAEVWHYVSGPGITYLTFPLNAGPHKIYLAYREANTKIDKFFITNTNTPPTAFGEDASNCGVCESNQYQTLNESYLCPGDSIFLEGQYVDTAGIYIDTFAAANGCDSIVIVDLKPGDTMTVDVETPICFGDSIWVGGAYQMEAGFYVDTLQNFTGCDSIVQTTLTIIPVTRDTVVFAICATDSIFLAGAYQNTSGLYLDTLQAGSGCDSFVVTELNIFPVYEDTVQVDICVWDSLFVAGDFQNEVGFYVDSLQTDRGCDSIIITELGILDSCIWVGGTRIYVDSSATGQNNGTGWLDAFTELQSALDLSELYDNVFEIWVAKGTYFPLQSGSRELSFILNDSVEIYGSFEGTEIHLNDRILNELNTILSGDINTKGDSLDNSFHIITVDTLAANPLLDGFIIENAVANGVGENAVGPAIFSKGSARFSNITIRRVSADGEGRAIYSFGPSSISILNDVLIIDPGPVSVKAVDQAKIIWNGVNQLKKEE